MTRRPAVTLIEALVAIFVMAIGLLALLTLFPLGAVSMAQALKDQRCAEAAINATSMFKALAITDPTTGNVLPLYLQNDTTDVVMPSGGATVFEVQPGSATALPAGTATAYPVYVDPIGAAAVNGWYTSGGGTTMTTGTGSPWMGGATAANGIPRATLTNTATAPWLPSGRTAQGWFTLLDDITYLDNGTPDLSAGLQREGRYSWAWMVRRVSPGDTGPLDLTVVVYAGRSAGQDASGNPIGETAYTNTTFGANGNPNVVQINWTGQTKPAVRRGSWVLDARMQDTTGAAPKPAPQGYFYRVTSVTDVGTNLMELEVQQPLGGSLRTIIPIGTGGNVGTLIVMENVAEIFEKGTTY
jgi:Tfp pilus assembly protein PilV